MAHASPDRGLRQNWEFKADLTGLATLEGTLDGQRVLGHRGNWPVTHDGPECSTGTFAGEFSGGIYGPKGEEAAGVFDFDGGEAGAFVGAFGGTPQ